VLVASRGTAKSFLPTSRRSAGEPLARLAFFLSLIAASFSAWGCKSQKQNRLSPDQVHAITRQMIRAAGAHKQGDISSRLQFDGTHPARADQLFITLPADSSDPSRRTAIAQVVQSLDRIGTANNLSRESQTSSGALLVLNYERSGVITQSVHIIAPLVARPSLPTPLSRSDQQAGSARLAIILDDLGSDRAAADSIFALSYPLTISVLPNHAHSTEIAEEAHRRGYEVMLHLPMQSVGNETPEAKELRPGMAADDIPVLFEQMMQSVPDAVGVNNHQGSQATANPELMHEFMPVLQKWNLFYVDSRTTAATVAYDTAQQLGVRSAFRNAPFLDDVAEVSAVRKQIELAFRKAREKGGAITIGHPHPATLQALREVLPHAKAAGIDLVYASDLVH
jgi:uncharacterized protein